MVAFLDVEASGLGSGSYPIELGWAIPWSASGGVLIRPALDWTYWNPASERLFHRISRQHLEQHDVPPAQALAQIIKAVQGHQVYSADPDFDVHWLGLLARAAWETTPFEIGDAQKLFRAAAAQRHRNLDAITIEAERRRPHIHRAQADAEQLALIWTLLQE